MYLWTIFRMTFSKSLSDVDKRLIDLKFCGNFGSIPGFGNVIILLPSKGFGKWDSRRQWLNKCVRCTNGLLGRCLRHSFGIPWSPQTFLNFNEFAKLCMSHGLDVKSRSSILLYPLGTDPTQKTQPFYAGEYLKNMSFLSRIFSPLPLFKKIKVVLWDHFFVYVSVYPRIIASRLLRKHVSAEINKHGTIE
jgi:hypothetical protein